MSATGQPSLSAVILAGGQSRRMGRDKAWIRWQDQPLIARAVAQAHELGIREVFISGRPDTDYSALDCPVLLDLTPGLGPLGGIERGLDACGSPLLLVLAVDLPRMTTEFLRRLAAQATPSTGAVPELNGALEPLAAIYPKRCHALACEALAHSAHAARVFAEACRREGTVQSVPVSADDAPCFVNWNRPADLAEGVSPGKQEFHPS